MVKTHERGLGQRGVALIITLLVTAIIVSVLAEIVLSVHMDTTATAGYIDYDNASFMAGDGLGLAGKITRDMNEAGYTYFNGKTYLDNTFENKRGRLEIRLFDESGRLSLNSIVYKNGGLNEEYYGMYVRLLSALDLPVSLAETLADWIDSDDSPRKEGAEDNDYYSQLSPPYTSKGGPLSSVEELYLVKGYGKEEMKRLSGFVTVYTDGKVNINTAPLEVIEALSPDITEDLARNVLSYRKSSPFKETSEIRKVSGFEQIGFNLQSRIVVKSDTLRASLSAAVGKAKGVAEAVFKEGEKDVSILYYRQR